MKQCTNSKGGEINKEEGEVAGPAADGQQRPALRQPVAHALLGLL
jgi:hypothetical protein